MEEYMTIHEQIVAQYETYLAETRSSQRRESRYRLQELARPWLRLQSLPKSAEKKFRQRKANNKKSLLVLSAPEQGAYLLIPANG